MSDRNHLLRAHAPISDALWEEIDDEARERLTPGLAVRRLVDFRGPYGWERSSTRLGRVETPAGDGREGIRLLRRRVQPFVEIRADFAISREELRAGERGAEDVDYDDLVAAAHRIVEAENAAVFHGWPAAGIEGIAECCPHEPIAGGADEYPGRVARAVELLLRYGVDGPYGLALGREDYRLVVESAENGGYPLMDHLRKILRGPIVWSPGVEGAIVLSMRGGDFLFESGQDLSVGYDSHDENEVRLYIEESFSFRPVTPEAAVALSPSG